MIFALSDGKKSDLIVKSKYVANCEEADLHELNAIGYVDPRSTGADNYSLAIRCKASPGTDAQHGEGSQGIQKGYKGRGRGEERGWGFGG